MSVCMEQLCSHWMDFHEIWYLIVWKSFQKMQVLWIFDKNKGYIKTYVHML